MDLINNSHFIDLEPGYSLIMNIDFTFYLKVEAKYLYGVDWSLKFCQLTSTAKPSTTSTTYCSLKICPTGSEVSLPKQYFEKETIYQEYKLRLYNY